MSQLRATNFIQPVETLVLSSTSPAQLVLTGHRQGPQLYNLIEVMYYILRMGCEQFMSLGLDADHAAMAMDRRPAIEQLKELLKKLRDKKKDWKPLPMISDEIPTLDLDNG